MDSVLIAGMASAFVLSVLDYWWDGPLVRALAGAATALASLLLLGCSGLSLLPMCLAATFVGAMGFVLTSRTISALGLRDVSRSR